MDNLTVGGKWIWYDKKAKRVKFLYFEHGQEEKFSQAWTMHEEWLELADKDATTASSSKAESVEEVGESTSTTLKRKAEDSSTKNTAKKAKAKAKAGGVGGANKELKKLEMEVSKLKQKYGTVTAQATTVLSRIGKDAKWDWANHEAIKGPLLAAMDGLSEAAGADDATSEIISDDMAQVKKRLTQGEFEMSLKAAQSTLVLPLKTLQEECDMLLAQNEARNKAKSRS